MQTEYPSTAQLRPELLAPAGNWECARAAAANGADAVYFGVPKWNARMRAENFALEEIPALMRFLHGKGLRGYAAFNVLVFTGELIEAARLLDRLAEAGVDAVIVQDVALARLAAEAGMRVHASTQMTITSPEGVDFARRLGVSRVVLAREISLREMERFQTSEKGGVPLEVFVHGALCVAYSGQCLTSEALGQRSANRGECAQACRLPYGLVVDGALRDLGEKRYLLSPQDLAGLDQIPELIERGVGALKIEGRLKSPEYVAAVCSVYRRAIDAAIEGRPVRPFREEPAERYKLEMVFSRGLFPGWLNGVDHQGLVHARYGKKRGVFLGRVVLVRGRRVTLDRLRAEVRPGDGVVFDQGGDTEKEQGGRVFAVRGPSLEFGAGLRNPRGIRKGDRVWKTDDPVLRQQLRQTYQTLKPDTRVGLRLSVHGREGEPLVVEAETEEGRMAKVASAAVLVKAHEHPLTREVLEQQLGRLGNTGYRLSGLEFDCGGQELMLPYSQLSAVRREMVAALDRSPAVSKCRAAWLAQSLCHQGLEALISERRRASLAPTREWVLSVLCRTEEQMRAALGSGVREVALDFEDIRRFKPAVAEARRMTRDARVFLATPRIQKAGEAGFFKLIASAGADGVLIRNLGAVEFFKGTGFELVGDFSLNIANPLTAAIFRAEGLVRLVPSFDLDAGQLVELLGAAPPEWFQVVVHQHIPMFHMEHCVFAAFLSDGKDHLSCGRPCDRHKVHLRDRVGQEHLVLADVGCRNTVFHGRAQTAAFFLDALREAGACFFRIDLLQETGSETASLIALYRRLFEGSLDAASFARKAGAVSQLGVTGGVLTVLQPVR